MLAPTQQVGTNYQAFGSLCVEFVKSPRRERDTVLFYWVHSLIVNPFIFIIIQGLVERTSTVPIAMIPDSRYVAINSSSFVIAACFVALIVGCYSEGPSYSIGAVADAENPAKANIDQQEGITPELSDKPDSAPQEAMEEVAPPEPEQQAEPRRETEPALETGPESESMPEPAQEDLAASWELDDATISAPPKPDPTNEPAPASTVGDRYKMPWELDPEPEVTTTDTAEKKIETKEEANVMPWDTVSEKPAESVDPIEEVESQDSTADQEGSNIKNNLDLEDGFKTATGSFLEEAYSDLPVDQKELEEQTADATKPESKTKPTDEPGNNFRLNNTLPPPPTLAAKAPITPPPRYAAPQGTLDLPFELQGVPKKRKEKKPEQQAESIVQKQPAARYGTLESTPAKNTQRVGDRYASAAPVVVENRPEELFEIPGEEQKELVDIATELPPAPSPPAIDPNNTRHIAWRLGNEFSLARLAAGAPHMEGKDAAWCAECEALARELGLDPAILDLDPGEVPAQISDKVLYLLQSAAKASDAIAKQHGSDHAALFEASLKLNTMIVLYKERPDLVRPLARAVRSASQRAGLDEKLWSGPLFDLEISSNESEASLAISSLYSSVESDLR